MILVLMCCVILIILSIIFPKSKMIMVLDLIGHVVILGGYNGRYDISLYKNRYNSEFIMPGTFEKLYDYMAIGFRRSGISFEWFHIIVTATCLIVITIIICKITDKTTLVLGLMFGYSMIEYALQIQWLVASAIVIVSIFFFYKNIYCKEPKWKDYIIFILLIIFAVEFHFAAIYFLILLAGKIIPKRYFKKICILGTLGLFLVLNGFLAFFLKYIPSLTEYIGSNRRISVFLVMTIWEIIGIYIIEKNSNIIVKQETGYSHIVDFVKDMTWLMLFVIPIFSVSTIVDRVFHVWFIMYFCTISLYKTDYRVNCFQLLMYLYNWLSFVAFYIIIAGYSNGLLLVEEIISNNFLWGNSL